MSLLGGLEKYSAVRHHRGFYYNVAVSATYTLSGALGHPLKDYVFKAVGALIERHPILSAVPVGEDTNRPYFVRLPEIDLSKSVFFQDGDYGLSPEVDESDKPESNWGPKFDEFLQSQHDTPFDTGLPFWRLFIMTDNNTEQRFMAVFVYHHAIGDGTSGKAFHATFLNELGNALTLPPGDAEAIVRPLNLQLLPSLENLHPLPLSIFYILKTVFRSKIWSRRDPQLWTGAKMNLPLRNKVHHLSLSETTTTAIKHLCRKHSTTITAMLQTLLARALFAHIPNTYNKLCCTGAVSSRRWLPNDVVTDDSIGVWVQDFTDKYHRKDIAVSESFPWDEAQRSKQNIEAVLRRRGKNTNVGLLRFVKDFHRNLLTQNLGKERNLSFEVSNIGVFRDALTLLPSSSDGKESDENGTNLLQRPQVGRMIFSQSANVVGAAVNLSVVTGGDGCLVLTLSWQENVVETSVMALVMKQMRNQIKLLVSDAH